MECTPELTALLLTEVRLYMIVLDKLEKHEKVLEVLRGELGEWWWVGLVHVGVVNRVATVNQARSCAIRMNT